MRGAGSRLRATEVLLLLALRTGRRSVEEEGRLCRPRRFGPGPIGTAAADGGLPPEGGAGVRPTPGEDRGPDRGAYLHLEVRSIAGMVPIRAPLGPGNLYPLPALRRRVRLDELPFGGFARGRLPAGCRHCTAASKMVLFVPGISSFHCFCLPFSHGLAYKDSLCARHKR